MAERGTTAGAECVGRVCPDANRPSGIRRWRHGTMRSSRPRRRACTHAWRPWPSSNSNSSTCRCSRRRHRRSGVHAAAHARVGCVGQGAGRWGRGGGGVRLSVRHDGVDMPLPNCCWAAKGQAGRLHPPLLPHTLRQFQDPTHSHCLLRSCFRSPLRWTLGGSTAS